VERPEKGGKVTVHLPEGPPVEADEVLVATGRKPATEGLGLESVGLPADRPVEVDDSLRATGVPEGWLYAVGDVNGRNLLTHEGRGEARGGGDVTARGARAGPGGRAGMRGPPDGRGQRQVGCPDPPICAVGRTEAAAREAGFRVRAVEYDLASVAGAYLLG